MKHSRLLTASLLFSALLGEAAEAKQIYAHYMGCFPAGTGAIHWGMTQAHKTRHDSRKIAGALGGGIVNYPLAPQDRALTAEESAELEIRRAMRGGIDGFAIDAWAGGNNAKKTINDLLKAAEKMKLPFYLTICMDPACHPRNPNDPGNRIDEYAKSVKWLL